MPKPQDHTSAKSPLSAMDETSIVWVLLRDPPVMPSRYGPYLDLVGMAFKNLPADKTGHQWLLNAMTLAATTVRSFALMGRLTEILLQTAQTSLSVLPAANSTDEPSVIHATVKACNVESFRSLMHAGYPMKGSESSWSVQRAAGGKQDKGPGALVLACELALACLARHDADRASQLLLIIEPMAEKLGSSPDPQACDCLLGLFQVLYDSQITDKPLSAAGQRLREAMGNLRPDAALVSNAIMHRVLEALLIGGADPRMVIDVSGQTLLHAAVRAGDWRGASSLLKHGADIDQCDAAGLSPIGIASETLAENHKLRAVLRFYELDKSFLR